MTPFDPEILRTIVNQPTNRFARLVLSDHMEENSGLFGHPEAGAWPAYLREPFVVEGDVVLFGYTHHVRMIKSTILDILPKTYRLIVRASSNQEMGKVFEPEYYDTLGTMALPEVVVIVYHGFIEAIALNQRLFIRDGFAKALFERHPIRDVVLTRQRPSGFNEYADMPSPSANWLRDGYHVGTWPQNMLAVPIWDRLNGGTEARSEHHRYMIYSDDFAAYVASSRACVDWGRELAGLEPLVWESSETPNGAT